MSSTGVFSLMAISATANAAPAKLVDASPVLKDHAAFLQEPFTFSALIEGVERLAGDE